MNQDGVCVGDVKVCLIAVSQDREQYNAVGRKMVSKGWV
jgi:hypothetical protein